MEIALEQPFEEHDINKSCMGAGILPIANDRNGVPHLLLGRERWVPSWKGSCRWSGFEGSRKFPEDVCRAASREFIEESMGVVRLVRERGTGGSTHTTVMSRIKERKFWRRIVLRITNDRRSERYHCTYILPVQFDEAVPTRFQQTRQSIEHIDRLNQEWVHSRPPCLGETHEHIGHVIDTDDRVTVIKLTSTAPCILRSPWSIVEDNSDHVSAVFADPGEVEAIRHWIGLREKIERALISHPAVSVTRDTNWQRLQTVRIHHDFLEKDQVRWWSINELDAVIDGRGQSGPDRFRPYFLPVLQTALYEMHSVYHPAPSESDESAPESEEDLGVCRTCSER